MNAYEQDFVIDRAWPLSGWYLKSGNTLANFSFELVECRDSHQLKGTILSASASDDMQRI